MMPRVFALLSWYDESPSWLAATIASIAPFVDHVIAVDGAYGHYPDARAFSDREQANTIVAACEGAQLGCTLHRQNHYWAGGEVEKRTVMFKLANAIAEPFVDWLWVIDADCTVTACPPDLHQQLAECKRDAIEIFLWERRDYIGDVPQVAQSVPLPTAGGQRLRCIFRCLENMHVRDAHYVYIGTDRDGVERIVWGHGAMPVEDGEYWSDIHIEHRSIWRDAYRRNNAQAYYQRRDELMLETVRRR